MSTTKLSTAEPGLLAPYAEAADAEQKAERPKRQASIDVYRGIVMFLMLAEVLELQSLKAAFPGSWWADWLHFHTTHVEWTGCSLHDLIQPSFSFLVGVSLPFSIAARQARGSSFQAMAWHAAWRSLLLIFLGIFLRSLGRPSTNFFFVDTLTQIGLGYFLLFLLAQASRKVQLMTLAGGLVGYWGWFASWPLPEPGALAPGVSADWQHTLSGFAAHWNKNANPAWWFDTWFMNLFPQDPPYTANSGGYCTLNFVPTLATMLLGVLAGSVLKQDGSPLKKAMGLLLPGLLMLALGWILGVLGWCPVVKRIWTPSWVLYSGGICFLALGGLYGICDVGRKVLWAWPLLVIGSNSITAYVMSWTMESPIVASLKRHLGEGPFLIFGEVWEPVLSGGAVLLVMWLILLWLYRQRIFVRI